MGAYAQRFNVGPPSVSDTDPVGNLLSTHRFPLLREGASSGQRNAALSDALNAAVCGQRQPVSPVAAEGLEFTAKKKTIAQLSPKRGRVLSELLYANAGNCSKRNASVQVSA
ncbi:hypothetical protein [Burkholderia metallica]|uniref:hypothetical protein n=1 Tax=Burkholderia metallica TaxID=488729 RepID=UPI00131BE270|nr:hypothetical protein [Burkholderia metallica]